MSKHADVLRMALSLTAKELRDMLYAAFESLDREVRERVHRRLGESKKELNADLH